MEQDTFEDLISQFTTRKKMLMRHIRNSNGHMVEIERRLRDIGVPVERRGKDRGRGVWQALWHALGVFKSEGDKLFKE